MRRIAREITDQGRDRRNKRKRIFPAEFYEGQYVLVK